jgi:hypothetical protein
MGVFVVELGLLTQQRTRDFGSTGRAQTEAFILGVRQSASHGIGKT